MPKGPPGACLIMRFEPEHGAVNLEENSLLPLHVTSRLALSPAGAMELANALNNMLKTVSQIQQKAAAAKPAEDAQASAAPAKPAKSNERRRP